MRDHMKPGDSTTKPISRFHVVGWCLTALVSAAMLCGCATVDVRSTPQGDAHEQSAEASLHEEQARFYWPYAALAAGVYGSRYTIETELHRALSSGYLSEELQTRKDSQPDLSGKIARMRDGIVDQSLFAEYKQRATKVCGDRAEATLRSWDSVDRLYDPDNVRCKTLEEDESDKRSEKAERPWWKNMFSSKKNMTPTACERDLDDQRIIPTFEAGKGRVWTPVPELEKYARARGWSIFVPDLKLDVWRRNRDTDGGLPTIEYAIVYRGTTGSGGWLSNLRVLTGFTPLIYDQYLQARESTQSIINQVMFLHSTSDKLLGQKTRVLFTAVGHSLGAGIANYVYYVSPRITRVVGFDPSPIDGGGTIPLEAREAVMEAKAISLRKQVPRFSWTLEEMRAQVERDTQPRVKGDRRMIDEDPRYPGTSIFMLYERGEILSRIAPCQSGPMWGQTGPKVSCNVVDLLKGDPISQHSMDELACSLHRIAQRPGEPPMRSVRH